MKAVHKFELVGLGHDNEFDMDPTGGILHVGMQRTVTIWVTVDTAAPKVTRVFRVFGTGHPIPDDWLPVGTCFDGPFVWHVFERLAGSRGEKHEN